MGLVSYGSQENGGYKQLYMRFSSLKKLEESLCDGICASERVTSEANETW